VVLLSAGVGITPMMAMLETLAAGSAERDVWFIHGARNTADLSFTDAIAAMTGEHPNVHAHVRLSQPDDHEVTSCDSIGRVDIDLLRTVLPFGDYDFYLCGPGAFVASLHDALRGLNVAEDRIHYEFFGPSSLNRDDGFAPASEPVEVRFASSEVIATWEPDSGSLLELAEAAGLTPEFGCRSGGCGSCTTVKRSGAVASANGAAPCVGEDQVLICSAVPANDREPLVLNL
jgi:ferredoxin-NADP reductase